MPYRKFTNDIIIIGLIQTILFIKAFVVLPVITKLLGPEDYGTWVQILVTVSLITPLATLGLSYTLVRFLAGENDKERIKDGFYSAAAAILAMAGTAGAVILFNSGQIANFFGNGLILVQMLSAIVIFECLNDLLFSYFRTFQQIKKYFVFFASQTIAEVALVIAGVFLGYGLFGAVLSLLLVRMVNFSVMGIFVVKKIGIAIPRFTRIKEYLRFGLPTIPGNISSWVTQSSDRFLISFFLGVMFVGYYAPAYTIASSIGLFITPFSFLLPAALSKFFDEKNTSMVKAYLEYSLKFYLALAIPSVFGLSLLSKRLITIFSTPEIAAYSYGVIPLIAASVMMFGVYVIFSQILVIFKKTYALGNVWIFAAVFYLILDVSLIPAFGILGAATTNCITFFIILSFVWYYSFKKIGFCFKVDLEIIVKIFLASCVMVAIVAFLDPVTILAVLGTIMVGAVSYGVFLLLLGVISKKEISFLKNNILMLFSRKTN